MMPRSIEGHAEAIGDVGIDVELLSGSALLAAMAQYRVMDGLPPGWMELPPVDPMAAEADAWEQATEYAALEAAEGDPE